jgi:hypothetical protein
MLPSKTTSWNVLCSTDCQANHYPGIAFPIFTIFKKTLWQILANEIWGDVCHFQYNGSEKNGPCAMTGFQNSRYCGVIK